MSSTSLLLPYLDGQYREEEEEEETERKANLVSSAVSFFPFFSFRKKKLKLFALQKNSKPANWQQEKKALKMKFDPTAIFKRTAVATCAKMEKGGEKENSRGGLSLKGNRGEHSAQQIRNRFFWVGIIHYRTYRMSNSTGKGHKCDKVTLLSSSSRVV